MTRKEITLKTIRGEQAPYTPYNFDLTMKMTDRLGEYYGYDSQAVEDYIGNHYLYVDVEGPDGVGSGYRSDSNEEIYYDEFGILWNAKRNYDIGDWGMVSKPIKDLNFEGYQFPDGKGEGRFNKAIVLMEQYPDRLNVVRVYGPLTLGCNIAGMEDTLIGMASEDKRAVFLLESTTNYIINVINAMPKGIDAVRLLDDYGTQSGTLISKEMWKKYVYPCLDAINDTIRKKGMIATLHSCGDTKDLFPYFIDLGFEVLDPVQPEATDIAFIKKEYGKYITLFGGLGSQSTIPLGTPFEVVKEAEDTLAFLGEGGKYILGPAGSIPTEAPIENVVALVDFCKSQVTCEWI